MSPDPKNDFNIESHREWPVNDLSFTRMVIEGGHTNIMKDILARGADPCAEIQDDLTPLSYAVIHGEKEIVDILLEDERTAAVLEKKICIRGGKTPLMLAVLHHREDIARSLIKVGASINTRDDDGRTALHWAASGGSHRLVKLLVTAGADIDKAVDNDGCTPLHLALSGGDSAFDLLLAYGSDLLAKDRHNETIAHLAARFNKTGILEAAFRAGVDLNAFNQEGHTPYDIAEWFHRKEAKEKITALLAEKGEKPKCIRGKNFDFGGGGVA